LLSISCALAASADFPLRINTAANAKPSGHVLDNRAQLFFFIEFISCSPPHYIYRFFCFLSGISKCESRRVGAQLFIYVVQASVAHRGGAEERREA
jgi:hypothetical protein